MNELIEDIGRFQDDLLDMRKAMTDWLEWLEQLS